jgi:hypothetical protein
MAKLSAHGRTELARVSKRIDQASPDPTHPYAVRYERTMMSDGVTLEKVTFYPADAPKHDTGWTVRGKVKAGMTPGAWIEMYRAQGWTV